jgi:hypothetical protein
MTTNRVLEKAANLDKVLRYVTPGLLGGGIGALTLGGLEYLQDKDEPSEIRNRRIKNRAMLGGILGSTMGVGGRAALDAYSGFKNLPDEGAKILAEKAVSDKTVKALVDYEAAQAVLDNAVKESPAANAVSQGARGLADAIAENRGNVTAAGAFLGSVPGVIKGTKAAINAKGIPDPSFKSIDDALKSAYKNPFTGKLVLPVEAREYIRNRVNPGSSARETIKNIWAAKSLADGKKIPAKIPYDPRVNLAAVNLMKDTATADGRLLLTALSQAKSTGRFLKGRLLPLAGLTAAYTTAGAAAPNALELAARGAAGIADGLGGIDRAKVDELAEKARDAKKFYEQLKAEEVARLQQLTSQTRGVR